MKYEYGSIKSKIWLIGDSPPVRWKDELEYPLDIRHPAIHNIWTPILNKINAALFKSGLRLNEEAFYIRNAVEDSTIWNCQMRLNISVDQLRRLISTKKPTVVITFGSRAFAVASKDFIMRDGKMQQISSQELGNKFRTALDSSNFNIADSNILPLLHASVSRRHFLKAQAHFCNYDEEEYSGETALDDYFSYTGEKIAEVLDQDFFRNLEKSVNPFVKNK